MVSSLYLKEPNLLVKESTFLVKGVSWYGFPAYLPPRAPEADAEAALGPAQGVSLRGGGDSGRRRDDLWPTRPFGTGSTGTSPGGCLRGTSVPPGGRGGGDPPRASPE